MYRTFSILLIALLLGNTGIAQLTVTPNATADQLVKTLAGSGVTISSPTLTCAGNANGVFTTISSTLGLSGGIVLTNGSAVDTTFYVYDSLWGTTVGGFDYGVGNPASDFASTANATPGDTDLSALAGGVVTYDACVLEFDFTATGDTVSFNYVFGSEEYTSYTCSSYNDVIGFFLSGGAYTAKTNISLVPGTSIPVAINSVNCGATGAYSTSTCSAEYAGAPYCTYYVDNTAGTTIVYDGFTSVLQAVAAVNPCTPYHLKLGVADVGDDLYDSGVFLQAGSFSSSSSSTSYAGVLASFTTSIDSGCAPLVVHFTNTSKEATSYYWDLGNGTTSTASDSVAGSYLSVGTYTVTLTAYNDSSSCSFTKIITVYPPPTVSFTANDTMVCPGTSVTFTSTTISGSPGAVTYSWNFGDGTSSTGSTPIHTYSSGGYYNITLAVTNSAGCVSALSKESYIHVSSSLFPTAGSIISSSTTLSTGSTELLYDSTSGGVWSSNASIVTVSSAGVVTGISAGNAAITYTVTNGCGSASVTFSLLVINCSKEQIISTIAGNNVFGYSGNGGPATAAELDVPTGVAFDANGNMYIADLYNNVVRKVTTSGTIFTIAGNGYGAGAYGKGGYSGDGGPAFNAELNTPFAVAVDDTGNVYIADAYNNVIRKVSTSGIISTFAGTGFGAGTGTGGYSGDGGPATAAELAIPYGVAFDATENLYIVDANNSVIRKVNTSGTISTIAGNGSWGYSGDGGPATDAQLYLPSGVCVDGAGNIYIDDYFNNVIRKVNTAGTISTVAGNGFDAGTGAFTGYNGDGGPATDAELDFPTGVCLDVAGNLYIADAHNNTIRKVNTSGIITTVAGNGYQAGSYSGGYSGDGGDAIAGELHNPTGVFVDASENLYIADASNSVIRKVGGISGSLNMHTGSSLTFADDAAGGTWSSSNSSIATVNSSGLVTGISAGMDTIRYSVTNSLGSAVASYVFNVGTPTVAPITGASAVCAGSEITLSDITPGGVWSSNRPYFATIDSAGTVTGVNGDGNTIIYYTIGTVCESASANATITVNPLPYAGSIIAAYSSICKGGVLAVDDAISGGTWSSSSGIADVTSFGLVIGLSGGVDTIKYSVNNSCGSATANYVLTVNTAPDAGKITGSTSVAPGSSITVSDSGGVSGGTWKSLNPYFFTINATSPSTAVVTSINTYGEGAITYTVKNACGSATATTYISVITDLAVNNIPSSASNILLYPNPAQTILHIDAPQKVNARLTTIDGKPLRELHNAKDIDISNYANGVYLVEIYNEDGVKLKTERVVKVE